MSGILQSPICSPDQCNICSSDPAQLTCSALAAVTVQYTHGESWMYQHLLITQSTNSVNGDHNYPRKWLKWKDSEISGQWGLLSDLFIWSDLTIWYSLSLSWFLINIRLERLCWKWIYNKGICIFLLRTIPLLMLELMNRMYGLQGKNNSFCLSSHCGTLVLVPCESLSFSFKHSIVNQVF